MIDDLLNDVTGHAPGGGPGHPAGAEGPQERGDEGADEGTGQGSGEGSATGSGRRRRVELDPDTVERDLARLVLTVVELLRQLMERQALRRVETGELTEDQEERIGLTLMLLENRMGELRSKFGLRPEDLNIDLGPLGPLLPR
ncbi:hypothetical protein GCM10022284_47470 [Streptomyces hundungensis]